MKKNNKFVIAINKINDETNVSKMIDCIDQLKSSFKNNDVVFEKNVNFAHDDLIKTLNTIVHLKVFNDDKLQSNVSLNDVIYKNFVKIFDIIVNANSNTFILFMLNTIEKKFE